MREEACPLLRRYLRVESGFRPHRSPRVDSKHCSGPALPLTVSGPNAKRKHALGIMRGKLECLKLTESSLVTSDRKWSFGDRSEIRRTLFEMGEQNVRSGCSFCSI